MGFKGELDNLERELEESRVQAERTRAERAEIEREHKENTAFATQEIRNEMRSFILGARPLLQDKLLDVASFLNDKEPLFPRWKFFTMDGTVGYRDLDEVLDTHYDTEAEYFGYALARILSYKEYGRDGNSGRIVLYNCVYAGLVRNTRFIISRIDADRPLFSSWLGAPTPSGHGLDHSGDIFTFPQGVDLKQSVQQLSDSNSVTYRQLEGFSSERLLAIANDIKSNPQKTWLY